MGETKLKISLQSYGFPLKDNYIKNFEWEKQIKKYTYIILTDFP